MPADDLDLLAETSEVEPHRSRPLAVVGALALAAAVATLVVVVLAHVFTAGQSTAVGGADRTQLTVAEIEQFTGLDLPDDAEVTTSFFAESGDSVELSAELTVPEDAANPFDGTAFYEVEDNGGWPAVADGLFYEATGEFGALNAEGVYAPGFVGVHLRRDK